MATFLIGAATGGVLFGWLGDRIGRVRALSLSILTYALFTGACGLATEAWHIAVLRFIASLGMGGEWSLGVALVNEVWLERSRSWLAGLIGAAVVIAAWSPLVTSTLVRAIVTPLGIAAALVWLYQFHDECGSRFLLATGVVGGVTATFYGWFPLYLPELFATSVQATSRGFAYNFGRVLAAVGTLQTAPLMSRFDGSFAMAGTVLSSTYLLGLAVILFAPATSGLGKTLQGPGEA